MADIRLHALLAEVAKEDMSPGIRETLPDISALFGKIHDTYEGVVNNYLGRPGRNAAGAWYNTDWVYRWIWRTAIGGMFKFSAPNPALHDDLGADNVAINKTNADFPGIAEHVTSRYANPYVALAEGRGTIALPWQLLRYNKLSSVMTDVLAQEIQNSTELVAQSEAVSYFSRNPSWAECIRTRALTAISGSAHSDVALEEDLNGDAATGKLTFSRIDANDPVGRLRPGMSVDIWELHFDYDSGTPANSDITVTDMSSASCGFIVDQVDYLGPSSVATGSGAVSFIDKAGGTPQTPTTMGHADDCVVYVVTIRSSATLATASNVGATPAAAFAAATTATQALQALFDANVTVSAAYGADGLESFIKTAYSDTLYGISLVQLPQLKSMGIELTTADYLTERRLNDWIGWFLTQYGAKKCFDTLVTTNGVLNGYFANLLSPTISGTSHPHQRFTYDRTGGKKVSETTGWAGLNVTYRGRDFEIIDDPICTRATMYGIKTKNKNMKRLMPPPIPGADKKPRFRDVEFVASLGGSRGIFKWAHNSSGETTDFLEAPYVVTYQHFVTDPCSLKVTNLLESTGFTVT